MSEPEEVAVLLALLAQRDAELQEREAELRAREAELREVSSGLRESPSVRAGWVRLLVSGSEKEEPTVASEAEYCKGEVQQKDRQGYENVRRRFERGSAWPPTTRGCTAWGRQRTARTSRGTRRRRRSRVM